MAQELGVPLKPNSHCRWAPEENLKGLFGKCVWLSSGATVQLVLFAPKFQSPNGLVPRIQHFNLRKAREPGGSTGYDPELFLALKLTNLYREFSMST